MDQQPPEVRAMIFAHCDYVTENRLQQTCKTFAEDLPGMRMPTVFRQFAQEKGLTWIHHELLRHALKHGPKWIQRVLGINAFDYNEIRLPPFFLKSKSDPGQSVLIPGIALKATLNPASIPFRSVSQEQFERLACGRFSQHHIRIPIQDPDPAPMLKPPREKDWNFQWQVSFFVHAWTWQQIEEQLPFIPWGDLVEITAPPPRSGVARIPGFRVEGMMGVVTEAPGGAPTVTVRMEGYIQ
jgi:hypothetical protein